MSRRFPGFQRHTFTYSNEHAYEGKVRYALVKASSSFLLSLGGALVKCIGGSNSPAIWDPS